MLLKENLDKRICDVEQGFTNTQTYREFIRQSEQEFGMKEAPINKITDKALDEYIEFLDYLWDK